MKKIFFSTALILSGAFITASAQSTKTTASGISFGIRAGVNLQNINGKDFDGDKLENKLVPRFQGGVLVDIPLADQFYIQPGVLFSGKGAKEKDTDINVSLSYLDIPVTFLFKPALGTGHMLLGVGPYVGFAIAGKVTDDNDNKATIKFKNSITALESITDPYFRRMDAGANLLVGYEMSNKLSVQLNAQLGLAKINPEIEGSSNDKTALRNTGFGLSLGYRF
ncbi:porin family protein [Lacibacter sediminis]|uniref:PorT family protein n=1 Tax=Lacibacter sediminis TaxID=2760713 RepID=A0A7G5XLV1_9BACT|nr:porin family protein [Lacibacter sediminis]QNA46454.1 PorT family protein [Lacibacter sediminis]